MYDVLIELHIHAGLPVWVLLDFTFSSRTVLYADIYHPLIIGMVYCFWMFMVWTKDSDQNKKYSFLYSKYYGFESTEYVLWFLLNLSALCSVHVLFAALKSKVLSTHFMPVRLSSNDSVLIDRNGHIIDSDHEQWDRIRMDALSPPKKKRKRKKHKNKGNHKKEKPLKSKKRKKHKKNKKKKRKKGKLSVISENEIMSDHPEHPSPPRPLPRADDDGDVHVEDEDVNTGTMEENEHINPAVDRSELALFDEDDAGNSIKRGFKNLIAIIEPNKKNIKYVKASSDEETESESDSDSEDGDESEDGSTSSDEDEEEDEENKQGEFERFYSLKGAESDMMSTDEERESGKFFALKTKSMAALLNLSKSLHTITRAAPYRSDMSSIGFSEQETSGLSDDEVAFGLKSGLYG